MVYLSKVLQLVIVGIAGVAMAHPGGQGEHKSMHPHAKRNFLAQSRRSLDSCSEHLESRGIKMRAEARRKATAEKFRKRSAQPAGSYLQVRDTDTVLNTSHYSNLTGVTAGSADDVFYSENVTCILSPEGEIGPFWVKGELVRSNLIDNEPGVSVIIDGQFIDVNTCEPISGLYWDVWNANSTGVYSGIVSDSNGNGDDLSNLNKTFLRGIQMTDSDGVAQFTTNFPGHYSGRTNHVHVVAHVNATLLPNNTVTGGSVAHIGQFFYDQDLITEVEATYPYTTNTNDVTTNAEDRVFATETEDSNSDPVFEYVLLGDTVSDGLFAWVTVGVDTTASYNTSYASLLTSSGGVSE
ncbi:MAG: hypothetical protein M1834_002555 [Cirrosporium novae-zelandiae]|nr:MAG: hypothetical protein M1834_002555 [Cirrosporium novae-zelandiae]